MSGKLGDLSESQAAALAELKERKQDILTACCTDAFLLRILRSAKFALPRAEAKLQAAMEFRKKWGADTILEDYTPPPLLAKYYPTAFLDECDRHGNLVTFFFPGRLDIKGLIKTNSRDDIIRYTVYNKEVLERKLREVSARKGRTVDTIHSVIDCEGLDSTVLWPPALDLLGRIGEGDKHSPELLAMTSIFRASRVFNILAGLMKPFLGASTRERLRFHGSDWKEKLLLDLHPETLPEEFGGTLPSSALVWGGKIPKELYLENSEELTLQVVEAGKRFTTEIILLRPGEIMWEFVTDNHDIGFGLKRLEADKSHTDIIPTKRVSGHVGTIEGSHPVQPGTYILEWDNSFSWTKPKKLRYLCSAVENADDS